MWQADALISCLFFAGWSICQKLATNYKLTATEANFYAQTAIVAQWCLSASAGTVRSLSAPMMGVIAALLAGSCTGLGGVSNLGFLPSQQMIQN